MPTDRERGTFLLPNGCSDLVDAIRLKKRRATRRAETRRLSHTRVSDAFTRWCAWAERYADAPSADVLDPALGAFFDFADLLTSREKHELESRIAAHPLGAKIHQQVAKKLFARPSA